MTTGSTRNDSGAMRFEIASEDGHGPWTARMDNFYSFSSAEDLRSLDRSRGVCATPTAGLSFTSIAESALLW